MTNSQFLHKPRLVVVGGGAAGIFCAVNAARMAPDLEVVVLEKSSKWLSKVRVSGGGRCNVTHDCKELNRLLKHYPRGASWLKKAFGRFATFDTIQWFSERGVTLKTEVDGRMFPITDSSETIIRCLLDEASRYRVQLRASLAVEEIRLQDESSFNRFSMRLSDGSTLTANWVCVTTGGASKLAALDFLSALPHELIPPVPSLFTFNLPKHPITELMGLSVPKVQIRLPGTKLETQGALLITHWGLSGPAVLKMSAWAARLLHEAQYRHEVLINWLPDFHEQSMDQYLLDQRVSNPSQKLVNHSLAGIAQRLWQFFLQEAGCDPAWRWADLPAKPRHQLARVLTNMRLSLDGKTTFKEEFVTAGGIALTDVDPLRMESRLYPGLFFAGEVLDVDGVTGGFNFQHAWTSGWIAAKTVSLEVGSSNEKN